MTQCGLLMCWLEMAHCTLTRQKSPAMCNRQVRAMPPKHSFLGLKKKSHNKVDILSRGVLKVVCSMWPTMASKQGHLTTPRVQMSIRACAGGRALKGGQIGGTRWTGTATTRCRGAQSIGGHLSHPSSVQLTDSSLRAARPQARSDPGYWLRRTKGPPRGLLQ